MKNLFVLLTFATLLACSTENEDSVSEETAEVAQNEDTPTTTNSYSLDLEISKVNEEEYDLNVTIDPEEGSYVVSPFSQDTILGKFEVSIDDNANMIADGNLSESPNSVEEFDEALEENVRFAKEKTTYTQRLKLQTQDDFSVKGSVWFVYEPQCTLEEINFMITYKGREMSIEELKTLALR
jgi:hypothetical protein